MSRHIFIIGPGGVGKTTSGHLLAGILGIPFWDLDREFIQRIGHIGTYIAKHGYENYCHSNSKLFSVLLQETLHSSIFVLSSGFLVHEGLDDLVELHKRLLKENGISILLLPSKSLKESVEIVVERQLNRGFGLQEEKERTKFVRRYELYKNGGDIQIYSHSDPVEIAQQMASHLQSFNHV